MTNPRLTAAVNAYMAYSGDVNERMRVALSAADDVAPTGEVSDAAVEAATRAFMDHYVDGRFNRCDAAVRASYSERIRSAIKAALPFMATQTQTAEFSDATVERLAKVYRDAASEGIDEPGWDNLLPVYKEATRRGLRAVFCAAGPFGARVTGEMVLVGAQAAWVTARPGEAWENAPATAQKDCVTLSRAALEAALAPAPSTPEPQPDARVQRLVAAAEHAVDALRTNGFQSAWYKLNEALAPFRQPSGAAPQAAQDATALHVVPDPRAALVTAARAAELALLSGCTTYKGRPVGIYAAETFAALANMVEAQS